ncbi:hypothetical protein TH53_00725 [Pedobacter lusitanus]|uniref:Uncharacterized protein n=1 Tax=Pedobacter lusitanus TaxID=1503925 RepID=A0A0D0G276_9SPHI|nr:hypothetical protein TH53_00725 [Pedobacter lusitanus]
MSFQNGELAIYHSNELIYPQNFAKYGLSNGRLDQHIYNVITENKNFHKPSSNQSGTKFKI